MAVKFPGTSGNYFHLNSALNTNGGTIFARMRLSSLPAASAMPLGLSTTDTSTKNNLGGSYADGNQVHGFVLAPGASTYDINEMAYWDGFLGAIASGVALNTWVSLSVSLYEANSRPAVKFGIKVDGGSFVSRVRNDTFWGGLHDTFANARILLGAGHGGSNPSGLLAKDIFMYASAITADADIEQQMDSAAAEFASPYWKTSLRGYASVALAAAKESGSAAPTTWTVNGSGATIDNTQDGVTVTAPQISGGGVLSPFDSLSASGTPTGLAVGTITATSVALSWSAVADATEYLIYGRNITAGESDWEVYQTVTGQASASMLMQDLSPRTQYGFKIASANTSGASSLSSEVTATTKNLRVKCRTVPAAAGATGVKVVLWLTPDVGGVVGEKIHEQTGLTFEAAPITDTDGKSVAVVYVEITQLGGTLLPLEAGDELYGVVQTATHGTWIMDDCVVQEV